MKKIHVFIVAALFIAGVVALFATRGLTISGGGGTFRYCVGANCGIDWNDDGELSLTNEATSTVTTNLFYVESCQVTQSTPASTAPADRLYCIVPDQSSSSTRGKIYISADTDGATGTVGTTEVNWLVTGYGSK